jgi:hypothetical protein
MIPTPHPRDRRQQIMPALGQQAAVVKKLHPNIRRVLIMPRPMFRFHFTGEWIDRQHSFPALEQRR